MKDLIQPEVRNEGEMRLWGAQVLKGHARSLLIYPKGNREPLTIHEERSDGVTLVFLVQSLEILSPEVPEEPDEKKGRLNPILTGASSKRSSVSRENEGGNIRPPPPPAKFFQSQTADRFQPQNHHQGLPAVVSRGPAEHNAGYSTCSVLYWTKALADNSSERQAQPFSHPEIQNPEEAVFVFIASMSFSLEYFQILKCKDFVHTDTDMLLLQAVMLTTMLPHSSLCAPVCRALCIYHYPLIHPFFHQPVHHWKASSDQLSPGVQSRVIKLFQKKLKRRKESKTHFSRPASPLY